MMMFHCPTRIYMGAGALDALEQCRASRVFVVTDRYFSQSGLALEIGKRVTGAEVRIFDRVTPDPTAELIAEGAAECVRFRPELLIALGGGSPMDCAKGIRMAVDLPMTFYAIPTTAGSGSEVTSFSIITKDRVKQALVDPVLRPDAAILDAQMVETLPAALTADTGMDLLAHCMEALVARKKNGFTDALAVYGVKTVLHMLPTAYAGEKTARGKLLEAAAMAGLAFDHAGLGLCHAAAHVLGGAYHLPHGRLCAMLLPSVMAVNEETVRSVYADLACQCGLGGATERLSVRNLTAAITQLRQRLGMPAGLLEAGVVAENISELVPKVLEDPCCKTNPVPVTAELAERVLKAVVR